MSFSREQLTYASSSLLDEFAAEKGLTRHPDESCAEFRGRVDRMVFSVAAKDESGPAFPSESHQYGPALGMTLRDYFAAKAMQAIITGNNADHCTLGIGAARDAYNVADAMLAARGESLG